VIRCGPITNCTSRSKRRARGTGKTADGRRVTIFLADQWARLGTALGWTARSFIEEIMNWGTTHYTPNTTGRLPRDLPGTAILLFSLLSISVFVAGCGASRPSDNQARKVVETHFQLLTQSGAKMIDFRKLNAESKELEGQRIYIYHFLAGAELPAGIAWHDTSGSMVALTVRGGFVQDTHQKGSMWIGKFTSLPKGTTAVSRGTITFRETEKGWISSTLSVDDGYCTDKGPTDCYARLGWNRLE